MVNLSEVALIWAVGLVAVISAINARGSLRISLSWFFTALVIGICVFVSTMKVSSLKQRLLDGAAGEVLPGQPTPVTTGTPPPPPPKPVATTPAPATNQAPTSDADMKDYLNSAERIVGNALGCAGAVQSFDVDALSNLPEERYEQEQSRALSLRNQAANISRQVKSMKPPANLVYLHADLDKAAEKLRLAGWAVHAYFSAENETDEATYKDQFLGYARSAQTDFKTIQQELLRQR